MFFCIAFCLAIIGTLTQTFLFSPMVIGSLWLSSFLLGFWWVRAAQKSPWIVILIAVLMGLAYANTQALRQLQAWLPIELEQETLTLQIEVDSLPVQKLRNIQYAAKVITSLTPLPNGVELHRILLSDYQAQRIKPCERLQVEVRLKRPHGLGNPVGFDYEAYLLEQGVQARGYVVAQQSLQSAPLFCIHQWRQSWNDYVEKQVSPSAAALIIALSSGEKSLLSEEQNALLLTTGTMHLFVISGSHIALAALAVYGLVMGLRRIGFGRFWPGDWRLLATLMALICASCYCLFAGFAVPSVRALLMLTIFMSGNILGVQSSLWLRFWLSMAIVLLVNPLAPLNVGFALSFGAVAVLILVAESVQPLSLSPAYYWRGLRWAKTIFITQCWVFIGLLPLMVLYFGQVSLISPLMNFIAVPVVEFLLLPFLLLSLLLWAVGLEYVAGQLLRLIEPPLQGLLSMMDVMAEALSTVMLIRPAFYLLDTLWWLLLLLVLLMLLPAVFKLRYFALLLCCVFLALWLKPVHRPYLLRINVLDVDQGLAVFIETERHTLLVDSGSSWPQGSMAERVVLPLLYSRQYFSLDQVLISHLDNDHVGGVMPLQQAIPIGQISSSEAIKGVQVDSCYAGKNWHWGGVEFAIVHPPQNSDYPKRNNRSCVLLIKAAGKTFLLPGDIEAEVEHELVMNLPPIDVLIAPHHGSKTSSTTALVEKNRGGIAVFSSGYLSRFGHPHPSVEKRYQEAGAKTLTTALSGLISVELQSDGRLLVESWRESHGKYWQKITRPHNHPLQ